MTNDVRCCYWNLEKLSSPCEHLLQPGEQTTVYPPALFAEHGIVDPLSLYLSHKADHDERTETALEKMMEEVRW